jgi:hypothetical protein
MSYLSNKKNYLFKKEKLAKNSRKLLEIEKVKWRSLTPQRLDSLGGL